MKNQITFDSNKLGTDILADSLIQNGSWANWNEHSGNEVQKFIKEQLASAVQDFSYNQDTQMLSGLNSFNQEVCKVQVVNMEPQYNMTFAINSLYVNGDLYYAGQQIPYSDSLEVLAGISLKMWFTIVNSDTAVKTQQKVYFYFENAPQNIIEIPTVIPQDLDDTEEILLNITDLFKKTNSANLASAVLYAKIIPTVDSLNEQTVKYSNIINVIKLNLEYNQKQVVYGKVSYNISGIPEGETSYNLSYYAIPIETAQGITTGSSINTQASKISIAANSTNCSINLSNVPGVYLIYARLQNSDATITSNWLQTNIVNITQDYSGQALIGANNITSQFINCDTSKLYDVSVISGAGGSVAVKSYISNTTSNVISDSNLYKTNSYENLSSQDGEQNLSVWSYNELNNVTANTNRYLGIQLVIQGNTYTLKRFFISNTGYLRAYDYYPISIVENAGNVNNAFNYTTNSSLDFSQITSTNNAVFDSDNIDPNLISNDGYYQDDKRLIYKVSPQYNNDDAGLFINPINLNSLLTGNFTLDIIYASENASDDSANFAIGNLLFGPGFMYLNGNDEQKQDSLVSFQKEEYTHLIITYQSGYKPKTYTSTYKDFFPTYESLDACAYNVLKIYVNGCINREIELTSTADLGNFLFQIRPTTSTLKMQQFRTYDFALNYNQIQKNTISGLLDSTNKINYYNRNNILKEDGTISFYKAMQFNNILIHVLPHGTTPVWFGQTEVAGSALLVHYKDSTYKPYNGRFVGKSENGMVYENQGSSANKYIIHNTAVKKFAFQSEESINNGTADRSQTYYLMPNDSKTEITKIVGKVNYASSMQSHKPGSCTTFNDAYVNLLNSEDYPEFKVEPKLYTGGRKAVNELPFLYFYYVLEENDGRSPEDIKLTDLYSITKDVLGNDIVTEKNVKFFGFQTWGSAKGDKATSGYDENITPEYILMEGADNNSLGANFKQPWGALQSKGNTTSSIIKADRFTGLVIDDETITYETDTDPWDIDFGCADDKKSFTEGAKKSVNIFADFCDAMYLYDFLNLRGITEDEIENLTANDANYKYYITENGKTYKQFDLIRYDQKDNKWIPGGLTRTGTTWDTLNLKTYLKSFGSSSDPLIQYVVANPPTAANGMKIGFDIDDNEQDVNVVINEYVIPYFKALFQRAVEVYTDVEDVAFHQAFIKIINGTDNRAKNTYFQIIGHVYSDSLNVGGNEVKLVKTSDDKIGYVSENMFYEVNVETATIIGEGIGVSLLTYKPYYYDTGYGDYKIRLIGDDLDTIFATNNNGQQVIPSYLLEPVFNPEFSKWWNDRDNALFYHFDLLYEDKIYKYVQFIIEYLIGTFATVHNVNSNLYKNYFSIQNGFPEIAYNHHAEIYYEIANLVFNNGFREGIDSDTQTLLSGFLNNGVPRPLSLSHGRSVESEYQFLEDRLVMLGSLCDTPKATNLYKGALPLTSDTGGDPEQFIIQANVTGNTYVAPIKDSSSSESTRVINYTLGDILSEDNVLFTIYNENDSSVRSICNLMTPASPETTMTIQTTSNIASSLKPTDSFKTIVFKKGLGIISSFPSFTKASLLEIDGNTTGYRCSDNGIIPVSSKLKLIETLKLTNVPFTGTSVILDFRECNKLISIDLTGCTGLKGVIIPSSKYLTQLILPDGLEVIQIGYCQSLDYKNIELGGTNLNSITIDGRNAFISDFIQDFVKGFDGQITINNQEILTLTYQAISILADIKNITFIGVNQINVSEMHFQVKFKLHRHKSFANITITGYPTLEYSTIDFSPDPYTISQGTSNNYLGNLDFLTTSGESANNIDISKISFSINTVPGVSLDPDTLAITVNSTVEDNTEVILTIKYGNQSITSILKVGFNIPRLGDFAYADGSFSPKYNASKAIGYVYECKETETSGTYQVSIMSLKPIDYSQLGYSESRYYQDTQPSSLYNVLQYDAISTDTGKKLIETLPKPTNTPYIIQDIIATTTLEQLEDLEQYESDIMTSHLQSALNNYINLKNYCSKLTLSINTSEIINNKTYNSKNQINTLLEQMVGKTYSYKNKTNASYDANVYPILFPAYLKTYAYIPPLCDVDSNHKVVQKYVNYPWKIPSTYTVAYLVKEIMRGVELNNLDPTSWKNIVFHQNTVTAYKDGVFSNIAENNSRSDLSGWIGFLGGDAKMASEHAEQSPIYVNYSYHAYTEGQTYTGMSANTSHWNNDYIGLRSEYYSYIYPCITILLSKEDYVNS